MKSNVNDNSDFFPVCIYTTSGSYLAKPATHDNGFKNRVLAITVMYVHHLFEE